MCRDLDHAQQQRDASRVVDPGLAFEHRARASADLASAEHGEHHRGVGWRECGAEHAGDRPVEPEHDLRGDRQRSRRRERPEQTDRADIAKRSPQRWAPMSRPPLNRITISATTPIRSTVMIPTSSCSEGNTSEAIAAPARNNAGAGIASRPVSDVATAASTRPAVTSVSGPAKSVISGSMEVVPTRLPGAPSATLATFKRGEPTAPAGPRSEAGEISPSRMPPPNATRTRIRACRQAGHRAECLLAGCASGRGGAVVASRILARLRPGERPDHPGQVLRSVRRSRTSASSRRSPSAHEAQPPQLRPLLH